MFAGRDADVLLLLRHWCHRAGGDPGRGHRAFGLRVPTLHGIINAVGEQVRSGKPFAPGAESGGVLQGYNVAFVAVARRYSRDYFGYARWFYRGDAFPALQCVWPDARHKYPWDGGFNAALAGRQPRLTDDTP